MKRICDDLQARLASDGPQALREDVESQRHLESCEECYALMEALATLDRGLAAMPALDVKESVVRELLERVESDDGSESMETPRGSWGLRERLGGLLSAPRPLVWSGLGTMAVTAFVALLWVSPLFTRARMPVPAASEPRDHYFSVDDDRDAPVPMAKGASDNEAQPNPTLSPEALDRLRALGYVEDEVVTKDDGSQSEFRLFRAPADKPAPAATPMSAAPPAAPAPARRRQALADDVGRAEGAASSTGERQVLESRADVQAEADLKEEAFTEVDEALLVEAEEEPIREGVQPTKTSNAFVAPHSAEEAVVEAVTGGVSGGVVGDGMAAGGKVADVAKRQALRVGDGVEAPKRLHYVRPEYPEPARQARAEGAVVLEIEIDEQGAVSVVRALKSVPLLEQAAIDAVKQWRYAPTLVDGQPVPVRMEITVTFPPTDGEDDARIFLEERDRVAGLTFRPARGYWQNTYVPGDPAFRLLKARLANWPGGGHTEARPPERLLDAPTNAAIGLTLRSDRAAADGATRALIQVGLQAAPRAAGRRPSMNVALVLDTSHPLTTDDAASFRALAAAFAGARRAGDHFSLVLAGCPQPVVIAASDLRHGTVAVALEDHLDEAASGPRDVRAALETAVESLRTSDDPAAPLGSSAILFATARSLAGEAAALTRLAHTSALAGIPVTAVGVGPNVSLAEIDRLALAGQGNRRLLDTAADAARLLDRELAASSAAVARAVRLRIRLAPGVKLVDVVGSRPLSEIQSQRVRDAERSVDLRLARSLGIAADRGEDEDGIQIVIPTFYAGDSHAVLLDVVAPGSGPIAEVTARYKDLAFLRNGVARASLALPRRAATGPLHGSVLKSLLAARLSEELARAANEVGAGQLEAARSTLRVARRLRTGLESLRPDLAGDRDLSRDVAMLDDYLAMLSAGSTPVRLADSLRYAGRLKVLEPTHFSGT